MTALKELYGATTHLELVRWLCKHYGIGPSDGATNPHRARRVEMALRVRLYRDDAEKDFETLICDVFDDKEVAKQRVKLIKIATEQNVTARIVDEVASLYDQPAVRTLANAAENTRFHEEEKRLNLHEIMQEAHRLLQLCNEVLVWQFKGVDDATKLRVVTPDTFDAIPDPRDKTEMAGVLLDTAPLAIRPGAENLPHFEIWDDTYRYLINASGQLVDEKGTPTDKPLEHGIKQNGVGRIPGVLLHRRQPSDRLLDSRPGRDIIAAHLGVGLLNVMIMRLSKSQGERQPVIKGNLAHIAKSQRLDGENPLALPPETDISMLDSQTSPTPYLDVKRDKITSVALRWGMSYDQFSNTAVSDSAKVYQARRQKLSELRGEQVRRGPVNENAVVTLMGFNAKDMKVDYQEQALPQDPLEELTLLDKMVRWGLDSPIAYLMRKNPDLTREDALILMADNLEDWMRVIMKVRTMNTPANSDAKNPGQSPQDNGAGNEDPNAKANDIANGDGEPAGGAGNASSGDKSGNQAA